MYETLNTERKLRALLRLAYIEQRWGKIDLDTVPTDLDEKQRREIVLLDMMEVGLLPKRFNEETNQIRCDYRKTGRAIVL